MGVGDAGQRAGEGVNDDDPGAVPFDGLPDLVGQQVVVDQQIGAGHDDRFAGADSVVTVAGAYPHLPEGGGHFSRMVGGGGGDAAILEERRNPGDQEDLFVGCPR